MKIELSPEDNKDIAGDLAEALKPAIFELIERHYRHDENMDAKQVARFLNVSEDFIKKKIRSGEIQSFRIGRKPLCKRSDVLIYEKKQMLCTKNKLKVIK